MKKYYAYHQQTKDNLGYVQAESFETVAKEFVKRNGRKLFDEGDYIPGFKANQLRLANNKIIFVDDETKEEKVIDLDD